MVAIGITTVLALVASLAPSAAFAPKSFGVARPFTVGWVACIVEACVVEMDVVCSLA